MGIVNQKNLFGSNIVNNILGVSDREFDEQARDDLLTYIAEENTKEIHIHCIGGDEEASRYSDSIANFLIEKKFIVKRFTVLGRIKAPDGNFFYGQMVLRNGPEAEIVEIRISHRKRK